MIVNAFFAINFICTSSKKVFVFITIKTLLDSIISIVYFRCMHFVCHDYFVIFNFVDFFHDSKNHYQNFDVFFFFNCNVVTCNDFNFSFYCLMIVLNVVDSLKRNTFIL